jgi:hypothetical protein
MTWLALPYATKAALGVYSAALAGFAAGVAVASRVGRRR